MKKHYYLVITALALIVILPVAVRAEDSATSVDAQVQTSAGTPPTKPQPRPGMPVLREQLRIKTENIQMNEEVRNKLLNNTGARVGSSTMKDIRIMASTTRAERREIGDDRRKEAGDIRREGREDMRNASSSEDRREIRKDMRKDIFEVRKQAITKQLNVSLNNLKQIRERISSRIDKAVANGKDMTQAKALLVIADAKIATAELAINSIVVFDSSSSLASASDAASSTTATSTVDLTKPREVASAAIKALKDAHKALVDVVRAIAHALGNDGNATSTPPVTATSTASTTTTI